MFVASMRAFRSVVLRALPLTFTLASCASATRSTTAGAGESVSSVVVPARAGGAAEADAATVAAACSVARDAFENVRAGAAVLRIALDDRNVEARRLLTSWVQEQAPSWGAALTATVDGDQRLKDEAALASDLLAKIHDVTRSAMFIALSERLDASLDRVGAVCPGEPAVSVTQGGRLLQQNGRLSQQVIQIIVRSHFDEMKACYERGLGRARSLAGVVRTKFVVSRDGRTTKISDDASTLPDAEVVACVQNAFAQLRFPPPMAGIVTVIYPIVFNAVD